MSTKSGIPSWQRAQAPSSPPSTTESGPQSGDVPAEEKPAEDVAPKAQVEDSGEQKATTLLAQAAKFLEDPAIRDAPREKKAAFLQSKGVNAEDIEKLLASQLEEKAVVPAEKKIDTPTPPSSAPQTSQPAPPPPRQDIPPIITYPEFLAQPIKPPPLITTHRLLTTAYITGGLMATMYGLSKFILAPMVHGLTEARHDFATHTKENLDKLNAKLLDVVSEDPAEKVKSVVEIEDGDDISEADSDPTELFHRDVGTQTTPMLSRRASIAAAEDTTPVGRHEQRLKTLTAGLKDLEATRLSSTTGQDSLRTQLSDLQSYLTEMSYQTSYYGGMGGLYGGTFGLPKSKDGKDDFVNVVKTDIRSVKGLFLSARNFPAAGGAVFGS